MIKTIDDIENQLNQGSLTGVTDLMVNDADFNKLVEQKLRKTRVSRQRFYRHFFRSEPQMSIITLPQYRMALTQSNTLQDADTEFLVQFFSPILRTYEAQLSCNEKENIQQINNMIQQILMRGVE